MAAGAACHLKTGQPKVVVEGSEPRRTELKTLDKEILETFLASPDYVLILSKSDCVACNQWLAAIDDGRFSVDIPFGKLNLDQRGLADFKRTTAWLKDVKDLPFNAICKADQVEKTYVVVGLDRLVTRLKRLELVSG